MLMALKQQQQGLADVCKGIEARLRTWETFQMCPTGMGYLSESGLWRPLQQLGATEYVTVHEFVPGAQQHETTGVRLLSAVVPSDSAQRQGIVQPVESEAAARRSTVEPSSFLTAVTAAAMRVRDALITSFGICGRAATSLGSALSVKAVRVAIKGCYLTQVVCKEDELHRVLVHVSRAADAFRHLSPARINLALERFEQLCTGRSADNCDADDMVSRTSRAATRVQASVEFSDADSSPSHDSVDSWAESCATCIQATWRGWALRTYAVDLRGAWDCCLCTDAETLCRSCRLLFADVGECSLLRSRR